MKVLVLLLCLVSTTAYSADKVGNGGDLVRAAFFATGETVIRDLEVHPLGQPLVSRFNLDLPSMRRLLTIEKVKVAIGPLYDNGGSVVDAIGSPEGIILDQAKWTQYILSSVDLRKLVFHELLRALAVNDDNYRVSKHLPIPTKNPKLVHGGYNAAHWAFMSGVDTRVEDIHKEIHGKRALLECKVYGSGGMVANFSAHLEPFLLNGVRLASPNIEESEWIFGPTELGLATALPASEPGTIRFGALRLHGEYVVIELLSNRAKSDFDFDSAVLPSFRAVSYATCYIF